MLRRDYQRALDSQGACNLSGLLTSLCEIKKELWTECQGTKEFNEHPIIRLYVEQLMHLAKGREYLDAYAVCEQMAQPED